MNKRKTILHQEDIEPYLNDKRLPHWHQPPVVALIVFVRTGLKLRTEQHHIERTTTVVGVVRARLSPRLRRLSHIRLICMLLLRSFIGVCCIKRRCWSFDVGCCEGVYPFCWWVQYWRSQNRLTPMTSKCCHGLTHCLSSDEVCSVFDSKCQSLPVLASSIEIMCSDASVAWSCCITSGRGSRPYKHFPTGSCCLRDITSSSKLDDR